MRILALETSTELGSCAFWQDGHLLERVCPAGRPHSETLMPLVAELLAEAGSSLADLQAIAFGAGPGAFTGLRVACGLAQGLAVGLDLPLLPVGSLAAMAWEAGGAEVLSLLDARMGEVYVGHFRRTPEGLLALAEPRVCPPESVVPPDSPAAQVVGNALRAHAGLAARLAAWVCRPDVLPRAGSVAQLGAIARAAGDGLDPAQAAPCYVRDKVARTSAERQAAGDRI
jgi:tRNA threonylcarbamoyladenosine biosynthesis protein TsaB